MTMRRDVMRASLACVALLLGACTSEGTADGAINYDALVTLDGQTHYTLHIVPDGLVFRTGPLSQNSDVFTLPPAMVDTLYQQATDAHFADLPAEYLCGCFDDTHRAYIATVTVDGKAHQTQLHELDGGPDSLDTLLATLDGLTRYTPDGNP